MRVIVMGLLGPGFWGRVALGCFEPGGRMLDRSLTEVERMFDGREGGRMLNAK